MDQLFSDKPHRRYNPLSGQWVLVSPHRAKRPWQGKVEEKVTVSLPQHDPACYLCPGNKRAGGVQNPQYNGAFVFDNDFGALLAPGEEMAEARSPLFLSEGVSGVCRVITFSSRHDLTLAELDIKDIEEVVHTWISECRVLALQPSIKYIQVFENKGPIMGCSNPHPHGQIWAGDFIPTEIVKEGFCQSQYYEQHNHDLLSNYLEQERRLEERIVCDNDHFTVLVPFWAQWPFETLLIPHRKMAYLEQLNPQEIKAFAAILKELTVRYDNLFETSFPYSSGIHQAPLKGSVSCWHWHMHFYPPLLRSATVKKFMVGYEMMAEPQRDITPEAAAVKLREAGTRHYNLN